jgi:hypothetical protein
MSWPAGRFGLLGIGSDEAAGVFVGLPSAIGIGLPRRFRLRPGAASLVKSAACVGFTLASSNHRSEKSGANTVGAVAN